jgi:hypothetical protein
MIFLVLLFGGVRLHNKVAMGPCLSFFSSTFVTLNGAYEGGILGLIRLGY